ncbi:MAG: addiction module protein [Candidatus Lokiarchaeota archaeon]|nr:addiction module protein [Candidatus Lokiarchaeota archaeon]
MASKSEEIKKEALQLPVHERASLAVSLIRSLDEEGDPDTEAKWMEEAERRYREYQEGKARGIPADEVFQRIKSKLG